MLIYCRVLPRKFDQRVKQLTIAHGCACSQGKFGYTPNEYNERYVLLYDNKNAIKFTLALLKSLCGQTRVQCTMLNDLYGQWQSMRIYV